MAIKVLKNFNGSTGEFVEEVERAGRSYGDSRKGDEVRWEVSYKGAWHTVFSLPACYGELAGDCISIKEVV